MRLFVAVTPPAEIRERLAALCAGVPGAKWVEPDNMHLTLRFIGEVDGGQASDIDAGLSAVRGESFLLTLAGIGQFGDGEKIRSLWLGVQPNPALLRLRDKVEHAIVQAGLPPERRKFKPHITLARFKSSPGPKLGRFVAEHSLLKAGPFQVAHFTLYSSFLGRNGAIHAAEAEYPLAHTLSTSQPPSGDEMGQRDFRPKGDSNSD